MMLTAYGIRIPERTISYHVRFDEDQPDGVIVDVFQDNDPVDDESLPDDSTLVSDTDESSFDSDDTVIEQVSDPEDVEETEAPEDFPPLDPVPPGGRPRKNIVRPARLQDYSMDMPDPRAALAHAHVCAITDVPQNYCDVAGRTDELSWRKAIQEELDSHRENTTWEVFF